jgi:hypothetical protein
MTAKTRAGGAIVAVALTAASAAAADDVKLMPLGDAWARNSVNVTVFRNDPITTAGDDQYAARYDADGHVVIAHRKLAEATWSETVTDLTGKVTDAHNVISMIADGTGYLHLSWDHHGNPLRYARSTAPGATTFERLPMTGQTEANVTYPQFFRMPGGNLIFMYRDGASGRGNLVIDAYDTRARRWSQLYGNLISGEGHRNAYWEACVDPKGVIHVAWVWRESPNVASNHDVCYARSADGGHTWTKSDGTPYALPITARSAEVASAVPQGRDLINQTSMCTDADGRPVIATYFRGPGDKVVQYYIIRHDGTAWQTIRTTDRTAPFSLAGGGSKAVPISRPQVLARTAGGKTGIWVIFRDAERGSRVSVAACPDLIHPTWTTRDLTDFPVRYWEPSYDHVRWQRDGVLDLYVQVAGQGDGEGLEDVPPQKAQVLEWKP